MKKWICQLPKSHNCGPIAVAVLAEVSLDEAVKAIGKKGSTSTKRLVQGLRKLGYDCPDRLVRHKLPFPPLALGKLVDPARKSGWHWVAIADGLIYDGVNGTPDGKVIWKPKWYISSVLPITKRISTQM